MRLFLRLVAPAALLGAALLLGERSTNPPDEVRSTTLSAASDEFTKRSAPCPGLVPGRPVGSLLLVRLPPASADALTLDAPAPEPRSLSPPASV